MKFVIIFSCMVAMAMGSDVIELTNDDFDSKIGTYETALVEFYAPWCGHCKKLAPEYEKAATALKNSDPPISLVKVDCPANTELCGKFSVSGYPTLKIFQGGEFSSDYNGPRQSDGIVRYMKSQAGPASTEIKSVEEFEKFKTKDSGVVIGFFPSADDKDAKAYDSLTKKLREEYTFGHSYDAGVQKAAGHEGAVVFYRPKQMESKFEDQEVKMTSTVSHSNVQEFMKTNYNGLCGLLKTDNADSFKKPLLTAFFNVDYVKNPKGTNYWRNRVMKWGKNENEITLSIANADDFTSLLSEVGLQQKAEAPVVMIKDASDKKYIMEAEFNKDSLPAFIKSFVAGELTPKIKSEPVPVSQDGPVTVVVGETFDQIVMDQNKDVLIEFYAPWCGHCKSLAPKYDELGEKMKAYSDDIVIAKIDATANEYSSQFQVSGFPTIYWAPKDNKDKPVKYNGGREVNDFIKYIKDNASSEKLRKTEL